MKKTMKRMSLVLVGVFIVMTMLVSCNMDANEKFDGVGNVSFASGTKSLSSQISEGQADNYYWAYAAVKKDNGGTTGQTTEYTLAASLPVTKDNGGTWIPGLEGTNTFSVGKWEFTLWAFETSVDLTTQDIEDIEDKAIFKGTATAKVVQGHNDVPVKVYPISEAGGVDGKIQINIDIETESESENKIFAEAIFKYKISNEWIGLTKNNETNPTKWTLEETAEVAGSHIVHIGVFDSSSDELIVESSIAITVYRGLTTLVKGTVDDITGEVKFVAHWYKIQSDGSWKCALCEDRETLDKTDAAYITVLKANGQPGEIIPLTESVDVGCGSITVSENNKITYNGSESGQTVVIRTDSLSTELTINAANDKVKHYGKADSVNIIAVSPTSYFEYGSVTFVDIKNGRLVITDSKEAKVGTIYLSATEDKYNDIILATMDNAVLPEIIQRQTVTNPTGESDKKLVATIQQVDINGVENGEKTEQIYLYGEKTAYEQNKKYTNVSDLGELVLEATSGTATSVADSNADKYIETKEATKEEAKQGAQTRAIQVDENTYELATKEDLLLFASLVNGGTSFAGKTVKLTADIDLTGVINWQPIGTHTHPFNGTFDGQNFAISNLTFAGHANDSNLGFFGQVIGAKNTAFTQESDVWENNEFKEVKFAESNYTAVLKNINIKNFDFNNDSGDSKYRYTGALAGQTINAYVENVNVSETTVKGTKGIGGIVGTFDGSFAKNCKTLAAGAGVLVESTTGGYNVGGLFGGVNYSKGDGDLSKYCAVIYCENNATVIVDADGATGGNAGGITGMSQGNTGSNDRCCIYYSCINNGNIDSKVSADRVGGIAGSTINTVAIVNCINNGNIKATSAKAMAGIAGQGCGTMINCINNGNVEGAAEFMSGIHTDDTGNSGGSSVAIGCTNNGILKNTSTDSAAQTSNISSKSREIVIENQTFADTDAVNKILSENTSVTNIIFKNCTVTDPSGALVPNGQLLIESDTKLASTIIFGTFENNYITINVPDLKTTINITKDISQFVFMGANNTVVVTEGASIQQLTVSGNNSTATVNGNVGLLSLGGTGSVSAEITATGTCDKVSFASTGTYTLTNKGTISHTQSDTNQYANEHTVCTVFYASNITINNYGKIEAKKNSNGVNSISCLFYGGCTVVVNNYDGSSITADNGYVLACGSAQSVVYNYYDANGQFVRSETKK